MLSTVYLLIIAPTPTAVPSICQKHRINTNPSTSFARLLTVSLSLCCLETKIFWRRRVLLLIVPTFWNCSVPFDIRTTESIPPSIQTLGMYLFKSHFLSNSAPAAVPFTFMLSCMHYTSLFSLPVGPVKTYCARSKQKKVQTNAYLFWHGHTVCTFSRKSPL